MSHKDRPSRWPLVEPDAELALRGARNFRSLKGVPSSDGRRLAGHVLMRSGHLDALDGADWASLQGAGLRTVCDLRSQDERARHGVISLPRGVRHLTLGLLGDVSSESLIAQQLKQHPGPRGAEHAMRELYRDLPARLAPHLRELVGLLGSGEAPLLVHCAVGKDRTGVAVAVLLHALGVAPDDVMDDYLRSSIAHSGLANDAATRVSVERFIAQATGRPADEATLRTLLDARADYLQAALDRVACDYGSLTHYLYTYGGVDEATIECLRDRCLETL